MPMPVLHTVQASTVRPKREMSILANLPVVHKVAQIQTRSNSTVARRRYACRVAVIAVPRRGGRYPTWPHDDPVIPSPCTA